MPLIFIFQAMWTFFNYVAVIRREPGMLGMRKWSLYASFHLRHYNELSHQFKVWTLKIISCIPIKKIKELKNIYVEKPNQYFQERLSRAVKPANRYMESFLSYPLIECAKFLSFLCSAILG